MINPSVFLDRWGTVLLMAVLAMLSLFLPELAVAQANLDFAPSEADQRQLVGSLRSIFVLIANAALYGGGGIAVVALLLGFSTRVILWAAVIAAVGGLSEVVLTWFLEIGGVDVIETGARFVGPVLA